MLVTKDEHTTAERKAVKLGVSEKDSVEVLEGVDAGEQVIIVGQSTLRDGGTVRVHEPKGVESSDP